MYFLATRSIWASAPPVVAVAVPRIEQEHRQVASRTHHDVGPHLRKRMADGVRDLSSNTSIHSCLTISTEISTAGKRRESVTTMRFERVAQLRVALPDGTAIGSGYLVGDRL